jgi:hypothetical protein
MKIKILGVKECLENKETFIEGIKLYEEIFDEKKASENEMFMFIAGYKIGKEIGKQNV